MRLVVIHDGRAHRDEFLCIGVLLHRAVIDPKVVIERRTPTEEELEDPNVLVLDCGGQYNPKLWNFDHHQMSGQTECAFSLLCKELKVPDGQGGETVTYHEMFSDNPWYKMTIAMDTQRPLPSDVTSYPSIPEEFNSPLELSILDMLSRQTIVSDFIKTTAYETIRHRVEEFKNLIVRLEDIEKNSVMWWVDGLLVIQYDGSAFGVPQYRKKSSAPIAVSVVQDRRGSGWALYSFNGADFRKIKDDDQVLFVHSEGFLAKTKDRCDRETLRKLISKARSGQ